jgi:hypothetical protein
MGEVDPGDGLVLAGGEAADDELVEFIIPSVVKVIGVPAEYLGKRVDIMIDDNYGEVRFDDVTRKLLNAPTWSEETDNIYCDDTVYVKRERLQAEIGAVLNAMRAADTSSNELGGWAAKVEAALDECCQ